MFDKNFNFEDKDRETISEEIRKLLTDTGVQLSPREYNYLGVWKNKILDLSGNN